MAAAYKGIVRGNTVMVDDRILPYDGCSAMVTILDKIERKNSKQIDWESLKVPTDRAKNADEFVRSLRDNDRL